MSPGFVIDVGDVGLAHHSNTDEAVTLTGRVRLQESEEIDGTRVHIRLVPDDLPFATAVTDSTGEFSVPASVEETYVIWVRRPGFEPTGTVGPFRWSADLMAFVDEMGELINLELEVEQPDEPCNLQRNDDGSATLFVRAALPSPSTAARMGPMVKTVRFRLTRMAASP